MVPEGDHPRPKMDLAVLCCSQVDCALLLHSHILPDCAACSVVHNDTHAHTRTMYQLAERKHTHTHACRETHQHTHARARLPRLKYSPKTFKGTRRWLHNAFFLSFFFLSFFPTFRRGSLSWGYGLPRFVVAP